MEILYSLTEDLVPEKWELISSIIQILCRLSIIVVSIEKVSFWLLKLYLLSPISQLIYHLTY